MALTVQTLAIPDMNEPAYFDTNKFPSEDFKQDTTNSNILRMMANKYLNAYDVSLLFHIYFSGIQSRFS